MTRMSASKSAGHGEKSHEEGHLVTQHQQVDENVTSVHQLHESLVEGEQEEFTLGGAGELTLDKVESLLGIQGSGKSGITTNSVGLIIKQHSKKGASVSSSKRKSEDKHGDSLGPNISSSSSLANRPSGLGKGRIPKVTLKLGIPGAPCPTPISHPNLTLNSNENSVALQLPGGHVGTTIIPVGSGPGPLVSSGASSSTYSSTPNSVKALTVAMKSRASNSISAASATVNPQDASTQVTVSVSNVPVSSSGSHGPRTPGTPSDHGGTATNPSTPGNGSSSMVNSPHPYVTISVDGESGVVNEGGVNVGGGGSTYVTHTYADGSTSTATTEHSSIYAAANGQTMAYPAYAVGESGPMYSNSGSGQYYGSNSSSGAVPFGQDEVDDDDDGPTNGGLTTADLNNILSCGSGDSSLLSSSPEADMMHHQHQPPQPPALLDGGVYLVPGSNNNNSGASESEGASNLAHASTRVSPFTVQWLIDNYETAEGVSLPRYTLYNHYLRHCSDQKLDPVNAASFGKLIRSVFVGLRTRRLGTRGNSKYHYYGIRVKPNSPLIHLPDDFPYPAGRQIRSSSGGGGGSASGSVPHQSTSSNGGSVAKRLKTMKSEGHDGSHANGFGMGLGESASLQEYLGDPSGVLDEFPDIDIEVEMPDGISEDDLLVFRTLYREHCESLLDALSNFQLPQIEALWRFFWRNPESTESSMDYEKIIPKSKLIVLCDMQTVKSFVKEADYMFYQKMVGILLPDVLRPIPSTMTQSIRNFAKTLENSLTLAMAGYPEEIVLVKVAIVSSLSQTLRRYTSLNHLAQAARAVLQNQNQITQMLTDLNRVDFHNVEEQASWVCGCEGDLVPSLEQDFKSTLAQQQSLEQWASWLEGVVDRILHPYVNTNKFVQAARHFLLKWSFYSSLVIRDLTLRSAASFGSFHLLRLLYDEYMFYLVEHRVAQMTGIEPIAVIGSKKSVDSTSNNFLVPPSSESIASTAEGSARLNGHSSSNGESRKNSKLFIPSQPTASSAIENSHGMISTTNNGTASTNTNCFGAPAVTVPQSQTEFSRKSKNFLTS